MTHGALTSPKVWAIGAVALATALTSIPYVYGALYADADHHFTGVVAWHGDVFYYLAQMRQFGTALLIAIPVTPEVHAPVLFNGLFAPLGWLAQWTGTPPHFWYLHVLRVGALVAIALAVLALAATAGLTRRARIVALLLALFASGWRWLVWVAPPGSLLDGLPYWRKIHEGSALQQAMTLPHLALASALVCAVLHFFLRGCQTGSRRSFIAAGAALAYLCSFHPFEFLPLWITLGVLTVLLALGARMPVAAARGGGGVAGARLGLAAGAPRVLEGLCWLVLLPLPVLAFFAIVSRSSPILQQVSTQMSGPAVEGLFLLVYYGPLLPLTLLIPLLAPGLHNHPAANDADLRTSEPHDPTNSGRVTPARHLQDAHAGSGPRIARATLVGWVVVVVPLEVFRVVPVPSHFREGLHLVCAILVAWLLVDAWTAARARRWRGLLVPALLLLLSVPSLALYLEQLIGDIRLYAPTFYLTRNEQAALSWLETTGATPNPTRALATQTEWPVVLADNPAFNLYIAPYTGTRPFRGANLMTVRVREKDGEIRRFFDPNTPQEERRAIAAHGGITHVVVTAERPIVRRMMEGEWPLTFRSGGIGIYEVRGDATR